MSGEARPISPNSFAQAIEDLPVETLYFKAHEINNSVAHLEQSNKSLQEYSDSIQHDESLSLDIRAAGDKDCLDAIDDNNIVIERQRERVRLLKAEVERRGQRWHEADPQESKAVNGGTVLGTNSLSNNNRSTDTTSVPRAQSPARLTDEELRTQLEARLAQDESEDAGMHL